MDTQQNSAWCEGVVLNDYSHGRPMIDSPQLEYLVHPEENNLRIGDKIRFRIASLDNHWVTFETVEVVGSIADDFLAGLENEYFQVEGDRAVWTNDDTDLGRTVLVDHAHRFLTSGHPEVLIGSVVFLTDVKAMIDLDDSAKVIEIATDEVDQSPRAEKLRSLCRRELLKLIGEDEWNSQTEYLARERYQAAG